jgi:hypothetical protein
MLGANADGAAAALITPGAPFSSADMLAADFSHPPYAASASANAASAYATALMAHQSSAAPAGPSAAEGLNLDSAPPQTQHQVLHMERHDAVASPPSPILHHNNLDHFVSVPTQGRPNGGSEAFGAGVAASGHSGGYYGIYCGGCNNGGELPQQQQESGAEGQNSGMDSGNLQF